MNNKLNQLNKKIIKCRKCPRLINFVKKISTEKRKQNINESYWGKPVPGFGKSNSKLLILGLAPAAHGGTRTGRAFTGDKSGDFLFDCLFKAKFSNQKNSFNLKDGLKVKNTYVTNIIKCVPPGDKPSIDEIGNCSVFLNNEILYLKKLKVILTLGKVAFDNFLNFYKKKYSLKKSIKFKHGGKFTLPDGKVLISSYHPSPRNVNTGLLNKNKMLSVLKSVKKCL
jgi:uracil-DNA glycosylase family 4